MLALPEDVAQRCQGCSAYRLVLTRMSLADLEGAVAGRFCGIQCRESELRRAARRVRGRQFELTARQVAFGERYRFLSRSLCLLVSRKLRERIGRFTEYIR